ncbi:hypothetical protein BDC45DRAFT_20683 [Circinella umbellata]|nr:hypothetical protein BDC45DRAFT_20683 [Circinella umbellata]
MQTRQMNEIMELKSVPPKEQEGWVPRATLMRRRQTVKVDLVSEQGRVWVKVIARNAKGLRFDMAGLEHFDDDEDDEEFMESDSDEEELQQQPKGEGIISGEDPFDDLPIFKKAKQYLRSASQHQVHFQTPIVIFAFMRLQPEGQDEYVERILQRLRDLGIVVHVGSTGLLDSYYATHPHPQDEYQITTSSLNLDVSTALALISEMSHHPCLPDQVLGEALQIQARREQEAPALPILVSIIRDKQLFMVQSAYNRLLQIVNVVGGTKEKARFRQLFNQEEYEASFWTSIMEQEQGKNKNLLSSLKIQVLPDKPSERFRGLLEPPVQKNVLNNGRKIRSRFSEFHAVIFGSGDSYRMTTITAIQWMQQALLDASLASTAIVSHEPRSLSEQKMFLSS